MVFAVGISAGLIGTILFFSPLSKAVAKTAQTSGQGSDQTSELISSQISLPASSVLSTDNASYLMINVQDQSLLAAKDTDLKRAPASTTKLLTGLVAMKHLKESDVVKVGEEVVMELAGLNLRPGDEITVENLLRAMYLSSANEAANALAVKASGSLQAFMEEMNEYAEQLGCTNSHFVNPHGLDEKEHYTTAADLTKIALEFLRYPELYKYADMTQGTVTWKRANGSEASITLQSTNWLLHKYPGDTGLKTGTTTQAKQCLISYVSRPDGDILLTLLGSERRFSDSIKLLDEGYAKLRLKAAHNNLALSPQGVGKNLGLYGP